MKWLYAVPPIKQPDRVYKNLIQSKFQAHSIEIWEALAKEYLKLALTSQSGNHEESEAQNLGDDGDDEIDDIDTAESPDME